MGQHQHNNSGKNLRLAFFLNFGFTILEVIVGIYVNSIAILSDAVHDLGDSFSLGLSWYLEKKSHQKADSKYSFGYARFSLLGAAINSIVIILSSVCIIYEAINRILVPESPKAGEMVLFAIVGVAVNGYAAWRLRGGKTMNEKVVSWHLVEDMLGWVAILVVGVILYFYNIPVLDPILSLIITLYILWNVFKRLRETTFLFLQGTPLDISVEEVESQIHQVNHVAGTHHTHIWSLEGEHHVFSTHVKLKDIPDLATLLKVKEDIKSVLKQYPFADFTVETELDGETCGMKDVDTP